jgi:glucose-6-phosphate isomerase
MALYEHKVFIESLILGVDAFDQWGIALGKKLALNIKTNKQVLRDFFDPDFLPKS